MSSRKLSDTLKRSREKSQKKMMSFMADQIARVVPKIVSELQGSNTPPSSVDSKAEKQKSTKFSYKHFISCNPNVTPRVSKVKVKVKIEVKGRKDR
ncbi:hypothetical protein Hanom_Chr02g00139441 [Helianthus anomalus]